MHIPDGFLSTPVWLTLDVAAAPGVGYLVRRAQRGFDESQAPLLGVMGAFVFAAQMINFPVGVGTSGHLVGGALLAYTLGPAAGSIVMTAILAIQALVFQDGGLLALGANVVNMAIVGVAAGYIPYRYWGAGPRRRVAVFLGGMLSVLASAILAVAELMFSGVRVPGPVLGVSLGLFLVSSALEGAITVAVLEALEAVNPEFVRRPGAIRGSYAMGALGAAAVLLAVFGVMFASTHPDGLEKLAHDLGIAERTTNVLATPLADYQVNFLRSPWLRKAAAGFAGLVLIYGACLAVGKVVTRNRRV